MKLPDFFQLSSNRVWRTYRGGKLIDSVEKINQPKDSHYPEDWIASTTRAINPGSDHPENEGLSSVVFNGIERLLTDIIDEYPEEMLGRYHIKKYGNITGFLLKFLDSAMRLQLQCHPTIEFSKRRLNSNYGKTEAYYILETRNEVTEPYIYLGFQKKVTRENLRAIIKNQRIEELISLFEKIPVKSGDSFMVPGGLPHAIGEGIFMIEVMEPSDFCVRIEFKRGDYVLPVEARFMNRGIDFALDMFKYDPISVEEVKQQYFLRPKLNAKFSKGNFEYRIIDQSVTEKFRMNKLAISEPMDIQKDSFYIAIAVKGQGKIIGADKSLELKFADRIFIPKSTDSLHIEPEKYMEIILALPPK